MKKIFFLVLVFMVGVCHADETLWLAEISIDDAAKKVREGNKRRILGARTEVIDGRRVHVIKSLTPDGRIQHHKFDAHTGGRLRRPRKR